MTLMMYVKCLNVSGLNIILSIKTENLSQKDYNTLYGPVAQSEKRAPLQKNFVLQSGMGKYIGTKKWHSMV